MRAQQRYVCLVYHTGLVCYAVDRVYGASYGGFTAGSVGRFRLIKKLMGSLDQEERT